MPRIDNDTFYDEAIERYGFSARGVHWRSVESQQKRFEVLLQMIPEPIQNLTLADAGCGTAALYGYLKSTSRPAKHYLGLELKTSFVEEARKQHSCIIQQCNILDDPLPTADYYLSSGAMNILTRQETKQFIRRCYDASDKGFIFNMLEGLSRSSLLYNYYWPEEVQALCESMGAHVTVTSGYLPHDFTVRMTKELVPPFPSKLS